MRRSLILTITLALAVATTAALSGRGRHIATPADCGAVLDRLVELELHESGYRDAAVAGRWKRELAARFAPELRRCQGLRVRDGLRHCLAEARTPEEITHRCLD